MIFYLLALSLFIFSFLTLLNNNFLISIIIQAIKLISINRVVVRLLGKQNVHHPQEYSTQRNTQFMTVVCFPLFLLSSDQMSSLMPTCLLIILFQVTEFPVRKGWDLNHSLHSKTSVGICVFLLPLNFLLLALGYAGFELLTFGPLGINLGSQERQEGHTRRDGNDSLRVWSTLFSVRVAPSGVVLWSCVQAIQLYA